MFSLQRIFGNGDEAFVLLDAAAAEGAHSVEALTALLNERSENPGLERFVESRGKSKAIVTKVREVISKRSAVSVEREEIEDLSNILYKLPKTVEKFAERWLLSVSRSRQGNFDHQVRLLTEAAQIVVAMVDGLKKHNPAAVSKQNARMQQIEGEADKLLLEQLGRVYGGEYDANAAMAVKDLHEILEKAIDHCRDVGSLISQLALKNS